jgi:maltooligosyltrehalose trehalohydrolase
MEIIRRRRIGAELVSEGGVHFRVWAPRRRKVLVTVEGVGCYELATEPDGYFSGLVETARAGSRYRFRLDNSDQLYPDPASRYQPEGPHGPSEVVDPLAFKWTDKSWAGVLLPGQIVYEMHVGTFTQEGTWASAQAELAELADLGITLLEVMPIADFPGRFGWGYDGVNLFAPTRLYGTPDDFRRFVDRAHALKIGVILDVVYNHFGPDGNYLREFSAHYFTRRHRTDWGEAINYDGEKSGPVREFVVENARYWIDEFHLDGLRLDATQTIYDSSDDHILRAVTRSVRETAAGRSTLVVAENEPQDVKLVNPESGGGFGIDALWSDDFHHSAMVALTGHNEAYYTDYLGQPQEFISAIKYGYLYQGQWCKWQKKRRGTPALKLAPATFFTFIQNHDQIANSGHGERCHALASPGLYRAITALMLLAPGTPMLFQGQEFAASIPFLYFADHGPDLARLVSSGRKDFLEQFRSLATPEIQTHLADPCDPATFERSKLNLAERKLHAPIYQLHRDLLRLRREDPTFRLQRSGGVDGAVLGTQAFVLRFFGEDDDDRLLLINLGIDSHLNPAPEPLLAPPLNMEWAVLWSSEAPEYGGLGTASPDSRDNWHLPAYSAIAMKPVERSAILRKEKAVLRKREKDSR